VTLERYGCAVKIPMGSVWEANSDTEERQQIDIGMPRIRGTAPTGH